MAKRKQCYSGIGGQAVLEGIMMRNGDNSAVAVRKADGTICVEKMEGQRTLPKNAFTNLPFVRGVVNFIDSMMVGVKCLNYSADLGLEGIEEEPGRFERWLNRHFGSKVNDIILSVTMIIAVVFSVGLFIVLPYAISAVMGIWIYDKFILSIAEAVMRFFIFIGYVLVVGQLDDIKRLYMYHGAEHKCIDCIEKGRPLTVSDVMRSSRLHPRCGTSFLLYVMLISCVLFFFINVDNPILRLVLRLCLVPVIAGIAYEIIRLAGRHDNFFTRLMSKPGLALQKITTREPEREMVEVAIKAVEAVFDWKAFLKEKYGYEVTEEWLREPEDESDEESDREADESDVTDETSVLGTVSERVEDALESIEDRFEEIGEKLEDFVDKAEEAVEEVFKRDKDEENV
ncbi:MAG: DUF1385 domain-containing protein [Lachnospiraceae bacterium]|nr:DUF1385 domain-containing protein [Lachnospiraceae bacterium]